MKMDGATKDAASDGTSLTACGETVAVVRKKALLRILARHEAKRVGIAATAADISATSDWFRREFGLEADKDFLDWIEERELSAAAFTNAMHDFAVIRLIEENYAREIDALVADQIAVSTARLRLER